MSLPIIDLDVFLAQPDSREAHAEAGKVSCPADLQETRLDERLTAVAT